MVEKFLFSGNFWKKTVFLSKKCFVVEMESIGFQIVFSLAGFARNFGMDRERKR